jgi:hypothetical protein
MDAKSFRRAGRTRLPASRSVPEVDGDSLPSFALSEGILHPEKDRGRPEGSKARPGMQQ